MRTEHGGGGRAVWPEICLFPTYADAQAFWQQLRLGEYRRVYAVQFPDDPRDASDYEDRTLEGIRAKYAERERRSRDNYKPAGAPAV